MTARLTNKVALITGASAGIGQATARALAKEGAQLVLTARREERLQQLVAEVESLGSRAIHVAGDASTEDTAREVMSRAMSTFGRIDILFNNAGSFAALGALWEVDPDQWWNDVTVNVLGSMLCCRAVLPHMIERNSGIVINMSLNTA